MSDNPEQPRKKLPMLQPLITPLRTKGRSAAGSGSKPKPKGFGGLSLNVSEKKMQDPKDFEITESGTFSFGKLKIAMNGMKSDEQPNAGGIIITSSSPSSSATPDTIESFEYEEDPFSRDQNYPRQQPQQQNVVIRANSQPKLFDESKSSTQQPDKRKISHQQSPQNKINTNNSQHNILYEQLTISKDSKLGSGATATVFRVIHNKGDNEKVYALKVVPLYEGEVQPKQILYEVQSLYESMTCPYIVRFYEAFHREGSIKMLLEYMDCGSLDDVYRTVGKIPEAVLSEITYQILQGLVYLEAKKIVHRDIKPANILLNKEGHAKISDFGMSKQLTASLQAFKTFQGTFMYMSPERLKGEEHHYDSDIWSMGVSIAECAIGRFPFDLEQFNLWNVLKCISEQGLNIQEGECSPELLQFVRACTIVDPATRPNASQLLQYPFITKHNQDGDSKQAIKEWIAAVYLPERKRKMKAKREQRMKEKLAQQQQQQF